MDMIGNQGRLLMRLLSAASERTKVISGNIANQNVPGFKRNDLAFEELLAKELDSSNPDLTNIQPLKTVDTVTESDSNGNNVTMETERNAMRENMLRYEMYTTIMKGRTDLISQAINGDR
ncbi:MAG: flagellar basal body rod protein FlgB [Planctomycetota bacterium]|nr:flagellar basal body rod protein FlgB [Planctomycetota bacterium]